MSSIVDKLAKVGLKAEIAKRPLLGGDRNRQIFQMNIANDRQERFQIWPGEGTTATVLDTNDEHKQAVIQVFEPEREIQEPISSGTIRQLKKRFGENWIEEIAKERHLNPKDIKYDQKSETAMVTSKTSGLKEKYLCGMDERHLFIAKIPNNVTTVVQAHGSLKSDGADLLSKRKTKSKFKTKVVRQGEWFFLPVSIESIREMETMIKKNQIVIQKKVAIGSGGKPHVADELVRNGTFTFIRGKIRHSDHKTVEFMTWMRVERNKELHDSSTRRDVGGSLWVD